MLSIDGVVTLLNDKSRNYGVYKPICASIYYGMSLHTSGASPEFTNGAGKRIRPANYFGLPYQFIFDNFIYNRHPRESEITRNLRLSWHKPYTQQAFLKSIESTTGSIFQDNNYSVDLGDKKDQDYIWGKNFSGYDLCHYFEANFQTICEDPNGFFIIIPKDPYYATTTSDIQPDIWFINSFSILIFTEDEIVFERSDFAWHINEVGIFRYQKDSGGKYQAYDIEVGGYYPHLLNKLPIIIAGGQWNNKGFYSSWLDKAKSIADDYLMAKSALTLADKEASHPFIQAPSQQCPTCDGDCKVQNPLSEEIDIIECKTCKGTGRIMSVNPGEWIVTPPEDTGKDMIKFIAPPIDVNEYLLSRTEKLMQDLEKSLHLNYIEQAQSKIAKDKDMESRDLYFTKISNDYFDRIIPQAIYYITGMRNITASNGKIVPAPVYPIIVKPTQFNIKTQSDLLQDYRDAVDANIPDFVKSKQLQDYVGKRYDSDDVMIRKTDIIRQMDILAVTPEQDKLAKVNGGAISNEAWQFNTYLPSILDSIIRDKGKQYFLTADYNDIKALVDITFKKIEPVEIPAKPISLPPNRIPSLSDD